MTSAIRKPTNVSLDPHLVADAKAHGINISRACENGLILELKKAREMRWKAENGAAIDGWNDWVRENGLPLEKHRMF